MHVPIVTDQLESRRDEMKEGLQMLSGPTETPCEKYIPLSLHKSMIDGGAGAAAGQLATVALKSAMGAGKSSIFFMPLIKNAFGKRRQRGCW